MNDQAPLHCREELSLPLRLTAALVVLLLLLPYHPLTWIATAQAGPDGGYCHTSAGACTCTHHAPADDSVHGRAVPQGHNGHEHGGPAVMEHHAPHHATAHEDAAPEAAAPPCHAAEAGGTATAMLEAAGVAPPATHLCGCGHEAKDLTSAIAIDRFVLRSASGTGGPPAPDAPTAVTAVAHLRPMAADIFHPPPPVQ
ncbi:MAG: hypothetical protein GVY12_10390 [Bacteroidetes bacterium]|jgi:hypothetical protein|nr:hypothetical protein [Bacteroidota bacterium]